MVGGHTRIEAIKDVVELKFDITHELSIIRAMGSNYKSKSYENKLGCGFNFYSKGYKSYMKQI